MAYRFLFCYVSQTTKECYGSKEGGLTIQAGISLPLCLCCHRQEKWGCRKSPWQLVVLKLLTVAVISGLLISLSVGRNYVTRNVDVYLNWWTEERDHWRTSAQPLSTIWTSGIHWILLVWKVEALLHFFKDVNLNIGVNVLYPQLYLQRTTFCGGLRGLNRKLFVSHLQRSPRYLIIKKLQNTWKHRVYGC